jgi:hypothetical protein
MGSESGSGATMTTSAARLRWAWQDFMACERRVLGAHARPSSVPSSRPVAGRAADGRQSTGVCGAWHSRGDPLAKKPHRSLRCRGIPSDTIRPIRCPASALDVS